MQKGHSMKRGDIVEEDLTEVTVDLNESHGQNEETEPFVTSKEPAASAELTEMQAQKRKKAALAVCFYWVVSLSLVFLNKVVMVGDVINLDAPLFMSWTQFLITVMWYVAYFTFFMFLFCFYYVLYAICIILPNLGAERQNGK